jgi:predicted DNA-binding antitoxin AbrB/MazE fold protein
MKIFAFWKYDQFPHVLGGEVIEFQGEKVKVKGYDDYLFTPMKVVDLETGKKMKAELESVRQEYEAALKKAKKEFTEKIKTILPSI